jgi:hypothetical protein
MVDTESILEGNWSSGEPPEEFIDFQLMREMRWTWDELQATPMNIRQYAWDYITRERAVANARAQRAARAQQRQAGTTVVEH